MKPQCTRDGDQKPVATSQSVHSINEVDGVYDHDVDKKGKWNGHRHADGGQPKQAREIVHHEAASENENATDGDLDNEFFVGVQNGEVIFQTQEEQDGGGSAQAKESNGLFS